MLPMQAYQLPGVTLHWVPTTRAATSALRVHVAPHANFLITVQVRSQMCILTGAFKHMVQQTAGRTCMRAMVPMAVVGAVAATCAWGKIMDIAKSFEIITEL